MLNGVIFWSLILRQINLRQDLLINAMDLSYVSYCI